MAVECEPGADPGPGFLCSQVMGRGHLGCMLPFGHAGDHDVGSRKRPAALSPRVHQGLHAAGDARRRPDPHKHTRSLVTLLFLR